MLRHNLYTVPERGHNIIQNDMCQPSQLLGNWIESTPPLLEACLVTGYLG